MQMNMNRFYQSFLTRRTVWLVMVITLLALALRLINLAYSDLTFDETASYFVASKPVGEMLPYLLHAFHEHPPVYFLALAGWMELLGKGEVALRLLSVFLGTLSIPLMYQFGRRAINARAGVVAALLLAITPVHIFYSQTARMYALLGALALLTWWLVLKLETDDRKRFWLALMVGSLIGLATHYYMGLVIASQAAYWLLAGKRQRRLLLKWALWLAAPLALAVLYMLTSSGAQATVRMLLNRGFGATLQAGPLRGLAADMLLGPHGNTYGVIGWGILLLGTALGVGLALTNRAGVRRTIGVLLLCAIIVPIGLMLILPETFAVRYVLFVLFPIILALSTVILWPLSWTGQRLGRWRWIPAAALLLALIAVDVTRLPYHYTALNSDYGRIVAYVRANLQRGDGVIFNGPWQAIMQSYYPIGNVPAIYLPPQTPPALDPVTAEPALREFVKSHDRVWVLPVAIEPADPDRFVQSWLNQNWYRASDRDEVIEYYAPPTASISILSAPLRFGDDLELQAAEVATTKVESGAAVLSSLTWRAKPPAAGDVQATLDVIDQTGNVWGQRIYRPGERVGVETSPDGVQTVIDRQAIPIDPGAPPGPYRLRVTAQRASSGEMLPGLDQATRTGAILTDLAVSAPERLITDREVAGQVVDAQFGDRLQLIKYQVPTDEFVQGGIVPVMLYWRALTGDRNVAVYVALVDATGKSIAQTSGPLGPEWYRAAQWQPQQVVATQAPLIIPSHQAPGRYQLVVTVHDRSGQAVPGQATGQPARAAWPIGEIQIAARQRSFDRPAMQQTANVKFGDQIQLLGYDLDASEAQAGGKLRVTFYWKALRSLDQNYVVFTHLIDSTGKQQGQRDSMPVGGLNPTPFWQAGEIIADTYEINIDSGASTGDYSVDFGWYQSDSGVRLPAVDANGTRLRDDIAHLTGVTVGP
jgi:uncharacterized membrane protein